MLTSRLFVAVILAFAMMLGGAGAARAENCTSSAEDGPGGTIILVVTCEGSPGASSSGTSARKCYSGKHVVPCRSDQGVWYSPRQCYISPVTPPPPPSDPVWQQHTTGRIYYCRMSGQALGSAIEIWLPSATPPPDPEVLARRAISQMQLRSITIGIVPEDKPDRVGLVGMPVWLWATDPGPRTFGPITRSASAGGYTVRATAKVAKVRWTLGDGATRVCTGPGKPYEAQFGKSDSPTCGYRYSKQGTYTVRAETQWVVAWSGIGQSGTIRLNLADTTRIVVGELQVVTVNGKG